MKRIFTASLLILIFASGIDAASAAAKLGGPCTKVGEKVLIAKSQLICTKTGKKLLWAKSPAAIGKTPVAAPVSVTTPVSSLAKDSRLTTSATLPISACKLKDATDGDPNSNARFGASQGFPRPAEAIYGQAKVRLLVLPVSLKGQPFEAEDLKRLNESFSIVKEQYEKNFYGKLNLEFIVPDQKLWLNIDKIPEESGLLSLGVGVNAIDNVREVLKLTSKDLNLPSYDGLIIETRQFNKLGIATAFPGAVFDTPSGTVHRVSALTGKDGSTGYVAVHELGHALFGFEDLYLFGNNSVNAGSWDLMSNLSQYFFAWNRYLSGYLSDSWVTCHNPATTSESFYFLSQVDELSNSPHMVSIPVTSNISINAEVRIVDGYIENGLGLLLYKVDSNKPHGQVPITSEKKLVKKGESRDYEGWTFKVLDSDNSGLLFSMVPKA